MSSQNPAQEKAVEAYHVPATQRFQHWWRQLSTHSDTMALGLVLWICTLPLVALIAVPLLGTKTAVLVALILFLIFMLFCWSMCVWRITTPVKRGKP